MAAASETTHFDAAGRTAPAAWLLRVDRFLTVLVGIPAAILVAAEIAVLFSGIMARAVFDRPLIWSDELASILFLWLAMLGAVIAMQRGEHMRMTAVVNRLSPPAQRLFDALAISAGLLFLVLIALPSWRWAMDEIEITTPALEISNAWRAAAFPTGMILMAIFSLIRLAERTTLPHALAALAIVGAIAVSFWWMGPTLKSLGNLNLLIFFVGIVAICVFAAVPIAFCFALATFGYIGLTTRVPVTVLVGRMDEGMSHIILLAVPLFVFLGLLFELTGMAKTLVRFLASLLGHVRGGLSYVLIGGMYLVSGISGSKAADMAAIAPALFPEMKERGAKPGDLAALLAATGAQTETIPPSIVLITIGSVTGVSISALFTGGLLPGIVLAIGLIYVVSRRYRHDDLGHVRRATKTEIGRSFLIALPALALPFVIRYCVVTGIATATEVSTIGIIYCLVIGATLYRPMDWRRLGPIFVDTACLSGAILLIIGAASGMAWGLTQSGFSHTLANAMKALPGGSISFMAVSIVAFIVLGSVLEGIPAIVLFGPLLFPIARAVGIHEVHYAMVIVLAMGLGLFAPPFGVGFYAACAIGKVNPAEAIKPIWAYMLALVVGLAVVAAVPWISIGFL
jgi:tripartite ATP-independent transporter DctM subunit